MYTFTFLHAHSGASLGEKSRRVLHIDVLRAHPRGVWRHALLENFEFLDPLRLLLVASEAINSCHVMIKGFFTGKIPNHTYMINMCRFTEK